MALAKGISKDLTEEERRSVYKERSDARKGISSSGTTTTTSGGSPTQDSASEVGVISSKQGEDFLKQLKDLEKQLGSIDFDPYNPTQQDITNIQQSEALRKQKGIEPSEDQLFKEGTAKAIFAKGGSAPKSEVTQDNQVTYINPDTDQTETKVGPAAGTEEERAAMAEKGFQVAEATTGAPEQENPAITEATKEYEDAVKDVMRFKSELEDMFISDKELRSQIRGISKAYDNRIREAERITERRTKQIETLGIRTGSRYTGAMGGIMGGIVSEEERQGLARISDIESQKQSAIIEAKTAARNFNYQLYAELIDSATELANQKAESLADLQEAQRKQDEKIAESARTVAIESSISELLAEGITDVNEIYATLNGEDGDVTFAEIDAVLKVANPSSDLADLNGELADFEYLKSINDPSVEGLSYVQFRRAVYNATHSSSGGSGSEEGDKVLSISDLDKIEQLYGVTLPYGTTQSEAEKLLGTDSTEEGGEEDTTNDAYQAEGYLRNELTQKELKRIADAKGASSIWKHKAVDINNMFDDADDTYLIALTDLFKAFPDKKEDIISNLEDGKTLTDIIDAL